MSDSRTRALRAILLAASLMFAASQSVGYAQALDPDRANRIREQINPPTDEQKEQQSEHLRNDMSAAITSLIKRIDKMESDMVDVQARLKALEQRSRMTSPGGAVQDGGRAPGSGIIRR